MLQKIANNAGAWKFQNKTFLWSVIALGTAALILLAAALALGMPALGAGAASFGFCKYSYITVCIIKRS